jgi:hypothetical protein
LGSVKWQQAIGGDGRRSDVTLQGDSASRYRRAFISYASADRDAVLARVQIMRLYKQDFFQDVLDLDPGTRWERRLYEEIARCDLFLLFWSNAAKESVWVRKEATEALRLAQAAGEFGPPTLCPVLLDGPPVPLPWPEVEHLHFNDQLIYFMGRPG